jgi:hypothetical protein
MQLEKTFLSSSNYSLGCLQNMNNIYLQIQKYTLTWGNFVLHSTLVGPAFYIILGFIFLGSFFFVFGPPSAPRPKKERKKGFHFMISCGMVDAAA